MAAHADTGTTYQTTLNAINGSGGSGSFTMTVNGNQATVDESFSGLADQFNGAAYPHVQHIHIGAQGTCPTMDADQNGDGVISTTEGAPSYGGIGVTLSTKGDTSPAAGTDLKVAPAGGSVDYHRTFTLDSKTMSALEAGTGVIVVHGLDPATLSQEAQDAKSDLVPSLPLAATSPALCGALTSMPTGGVATGTGSTSGIEDSGLLALGGGLLVAGGVLFSTRKRSTVNAG
ncbi:hypothetical protein [Nocardioides mesophilus]|nr:hypothetical protein [Nocardioides mesophilus]